MKNEFVLHSICNGQVVSLHDAPGPASAKEWEGEGLAFIVEEGAIVSPANGQIRRLPEGLKSIGMVLENGMQVHFYVGHLKEMDGLDFQLQCDEYQEIKTGQALFRLTRQEDCACDQGLVIPMMIRGHRDFGEFEFSYMSKKEVVAGETVVLTYHRQ